MNQLVTVVIPPASTLSTIAQVGDNSAIVAVRSDGSLWFSWQAIGATGWNQPQQVGDLTNVTSASIAQVGDSAVIAATLSDGSEWFAYQPLGAGGWSVQPVAKSGTVQV